MYEKNDISRLSRLTRIITLLQTKKIITADELAKKFNVSKRTIYRDIRSLETSGIPIFSEEGKGYSLVLGYNLSPISFTEEEANALITAEKLIARNKDHSLISAYKNAIEKIKAVLLLSKRDKVNLLSDRIIILNSYSENNNSSSLSQIQLAITNYLLLKIKYHSWGKNEHTDREIEPQALYQTRENWVLIAWCRLRKDFREFRLDRISD
jgi:predicted DNA-binding transcriptional regulator YafY